VNPAAPADKDRYFTAPELLSLVAEQWGTIDTDPAWDPLSSVVARTKYDVREGQDGLLPIFPWRGRVWLNPPYSPAPIRWLARAVEHAQGGGEVLALVPAAIGTDYWREHVWKQGASVCCCNPRPKYTSPTISKPSVHLRDCAVIYWGADHARFADVWRKRGPIVRAVTPRPGRG
jgi:hypothetical protein